MLNNNNNDLLFVKRKYEFENDQMRLHNIDI